MKSAEIRQRFLNFFKERDHKVLPSASLIPFGDPTLLFTSAGMVPFKPYFLGQAKPPHPRATSVQKVFRSSDIDVVGHDGHHLTFFEMLGNFSFGDYFKEKAIPFAYEFLTKDLRLEPGRLWAGIHNDDDESFEIWKKTGIPEARIRRFGDEYNFWAARPGRAVRTPRSTTTGARSTGVGSRIAVRTVSIPAATGSSRSGTWCSSSGTATRPATERRWPARVSTRG